MPVRLVFHLSPRGFFRAIGMGSAWALTAGQAARSLRPMLGTVDEPEFLLFGRFRLRAAWIVAMVVFVLRALGWTLRFHVEDRAGLMRGALPEGCILVFWHDRMFVMPLLYRLVQHRRKGAVVLTSASGEGTVLARILERFGVGAVRGSSSRQGTAAARELTEKLRAGCDVVITPDGPRGPRHQLGMGVVYLAHKTGAPVVPIHVRYRRCMKLATWDRFMVPLPFSRVEVTADQPCYVPVCDGFADLERERLKLEALLRQGTGEAVEDADAAGK